MHIGEYKKKLQLRVCVCFQFLHNRIIRSKIIYPIFK